ncbi:hypothetical protein TRIUR3_03461 [Triticum urartu]|uniref:Uncharacterized protein n=1 Tax=Triticum urartu TaxID=4572 RepID=M7YIJ6_TRIUA|nr:hypothetical protein TRIUR3_03461 [Triticum urartu]
MSYVGYLPAQNCHTTAICSNNVALLPIHLKNVAQELLTPSHSRLRLRPGNRLHRASGVRGCVSSRRPHGHAEEVLHGAPPGVGPAPRCGRRLPRLLLFPVLLQRGWVREPAVRGGCALGRAWRLAKGKRRQVVLYVAVMGALAAVLSPVHTLATTCPGGSVALGLLLGFVYAALMALVQLFAICAMTAFYYERQENSDNQLGTAGYAKLSSTEEATA